MQTIPKYFTTLSLPVKLPAPEWTFLKPEWTMLLAIQE